MNQVTSDHLENRAETLELINTEVSASLARQSDSVARIDTKAVVLRLSMPAGQER